MASASGNLGRPAELRLGLGGIAEQGFDLGGAEIAWVDAYDHIANRQRGRRIALNRLDDAYLIQPFALEPKADAQLGGGPFDELAHRILHTRSDHKIVGRVLLQHHPLHADIVLGVAPVAHRVDIAHVEAGL